MDSDIIELSELNFDNGSKFNNLKSANFGGGIELLMNDKVKDGSGGGQRSDIDIDDLNNLYD